MTNRTFRLALIALFLVLLPVSIWATCFRRTAFDPASLDAGPGWARWRMREATLQLIRDEWATKLSIEGHRGKPEIAGTYHWRYKLKNLHPVPIDSYWIMIDFDHTDSVAQVAIRPD
jgi:hypothetical protein